VALKRKCNYGREKNEGKRRDNWKRGREIVRKDQMSKKKREKLGPPTRVFGWEPEIGKRKRVKLT